MKKLTIKTEEEIKTMAEGGVKLAKVRGELKKLVKEKGKASDIEKLAVELIAREGGRPSFMMVPNYYWATCVNLNDGLVHGIPTKDVIFKKGDIVSVDVGFYYKGFHTDTSFTLGIGIDKDKKHFLETGEEALENAIKVCKQGNFVSDISRAIEDTVSKEGYSSIKALSGHGVGRYLHEDPIIPCFLGKGKDLKIKAGMVFAIEVMYALGNPDVVMAKDGWTISTRDAKISALYEETVAVGRHGPIVLTRG